MKCTTPVMLAVLLTLLVGGGAYYLLSTPSDNQIPELDPVEKGPMSLWDDYPRDEPLVPDATPLATGTLTYYIPEMGLRFEYPAYATVTSGTTEGNEGNIGDALSGAIYLSGDQNAPYEKGRIFFGGVTEDFSWPKGCENGCTTGYSKIGDVYHYNRSTREGSILNVSYTLATKDGKTEAIIITEDIDLPPDTEIKAIVNTKNPRFRGIMFWFRPQTPDDRALFESIIRSIELE